MWVSETDRTQIEKVSLFYVREAGDDVAQPPLESDHRRLVRPEVARVLAHATVALPVDPWLAPDLHTF